MRWYTVSDTLCFIELDELDGPRRVVDELSLLDFLVDGCVEFWVTDLVQLHVWEQVVDQ